MADFPYYDRLSPVSFWYRQSLFGYNSLKWDRRIEPVRYQEAKKSYVETLELVSANAIHKFFALATAQSDYDIASFNYANADTLYRYAQGRYNIGTITENEMLQLELNRLTEETNRMNACIEMDNCMQELRSYLGIHEDRELRVLVSPQVPDFSVNLNEALVLAYENSPDIQTMERRSSYLGIHEDRELRVLVSPQVPDFSVNLNEALVLAYENSPDIQTMERRKLESESAVAKARANAGLKADIYLRFGLTQTADKLPEAYRNLLDQQYVSIGISLPILDWGRGKGQVRVARSNRDLTQTADKLPEAYRNLLDQQYVSIGISLPILDWGRGKGQVRVARSNRDLVYTQVEQSRTDFELNVRKLVKQFNLQTQRVRIAARTDETAQRRSEVARKLYLLGKSTILDLNASISEKDSARRNYISALYNYWSLYYTLRSMTLYDFERNTMLTEDYHLLIE